MHHRSPIAVRNGYRIVLQKLIGHKTPERAGAADDRRCTVAFSKRGWCHGIVVAMAACWAQSSLALDPRYPDWPCQQLKVPGIAVASVWNGPSIDGVDTKPSDAKEADLVARLAARRTAMDDAKKLIADYLVGSDAEKQQKAKTLFAALYSTLNAQRDEVMSGIERFSRKQKSAAEGIREQAQKLRDMQDKPNADQTQTEDLASQLAWQTRIFEDRRKSTSYVCEVPVQIEKRLFDLGSAIQNDLGADAAKK
jgi:hypothetical protein